MGVWSREERNLCAAALLVYIISVGMTESRCRTQLEYTFENSYLPKKNKSSETILIVFEFLNKSFHPYLDLLLLFFHNFYKFIISFDI